MDKDLPRLPHAISARDGSNLRHRTVLAGAIKKSSIRAGREAVDAVWRRELGLRVRPTRKSNMRRLSYEWLAGLREIVIDPVRCPLAYEEFRLKEFERDRDGTWADDIPDGNDHSIDAVRYAMMEDVLRGRDGVLDSGRLFSHATGLSTTRGPPRSQYTSRPS